MTTETAERPISDAEIRDWAGSTGRTIGARGAVPAAMRAEYEAIARDLGGAPAPDPADAAAAATEPEPAPAAARPEARPRPVRATRKRPRSRILAFLSGDSASSGNSSKKAGSKSGSKAKAEPKPRVGLEKFAGKLWGFLADAAEHVNVPVARCMAWQAPYVGIMAEDALKNTLLDRVLQPIARSEEKFTGAAAVIATPFIVAALQQPGNQPDTPAGIAKYQILVKALEECIEAQLELFGDGEMAARVHAANEERQARKEQVDKITSMIFFDVPNPQTPEEAQRAEDQEKRRRAEAAEAAYGYTPPPGSTVIPGQVAAEVAEEERKVRAAEQAAGRMAAAGEQAAQRQAVATVTLGTVRL
jgi:hypothetical protein